MTTIAQIAPGLNGYQTSFATELLADLRASYEKCVAPAIRNGQEGEWLAAGVRFRQELSSSAGQYYAVSFDDYPLAWISADTEQSYELFHKLFNAIGIADEVKALVDCDGGLVLYSGFFVVGWHAPSPKWHVDYFPGANAFTLITPLYECKPEHGNLFFLDKTGWPRLHKYRCGDAIFFGEGFVHSTQPYQRSEHERVLVSLTFGTDKMVHWEQLAKTIGSQSRFLRLPSGAWVKQLP